MWYTGGNFSKIEAQEFIDYIYSSDVNLYINDCNICGYHKKFECNKCGLEDGKD